MPPDNPDCKYHPRLPQFSEIHGVNTECAEQVFKGLGGKFKHNCRKNDQISSLHLPLEGD